MINIKPAPEMSLQDIKSAADSGVSVMRSAHIGNHRPYNLAIASLGIPMLLVDHTVVAQFPEEQGDRNYLPGSIVTREKITPLVVSGIGSLSLQTTVVSPENDEVVFLDELHTQALRTTFPHTPIVTNCEYVRSEEAISQAVASVALAEFPELFTRVIERDGTIRKSAVGTNFAHLSDSYGILQLNDDPHVERGVLLPNEVDIVLNFIIEALRSSRDTQIHLSGPDMKIYTERPKLQQLLSTLYNAVRDSVDFGSKLPDILTVKLIPADEARFTTTAQQAEQLHQLSQILCDEAALRAEAQQFFRSDAARSPAQKQAYLAKKDLLTTSTNDLLRDLTPSLEPFLLGPREAPFTSQYDVAAGDPLFVMPENHTLSMAALKLLTKRIRKGLP